MRELASVIWTEARGVGDAAMTAVGWTLRNRMTRNNVEQVDEAWHGYTHGTQPRGADLKHAEAIACSILDGKPPDPTGGATHFYTTEAMPKEGEPIPEHTGVGGDLESVPGIVDENGNQLENYRPAWTRTFTRDSVKSVLKASLKFRESRDGITHVRRAHISDGTVALAACRAVPGEGE